MWLQIKTKMNKREFLKQTIHPLAQVEKMADDLLTCEEKRKVWDITQPIRAMIGQVVDVIETDKGLQKRARRIRNMVLEVCEAAKNGENVESRVEYIRSLIDLNL